MYIFSIVIKAYCILWYRISYEIYITHTHSVNTPNVLCLTPYKPIGEGNSN